MADQLYIRVREDSEVCAWLIVDADGRLRQGLRTGPASDVASAAAGLRVVLLVPGLEVVTTKAELPNASQARMRQMLPYSLEDTFAEDVDDLTFAIGPRLASGAFQVSVARAAKLQEWLDRLEDVGIKPQAVYADSDGVPNTPSTLTVILDEDLVYARKPDEPALALQGLPLQQAFAVAAASSEAPEVQHAIVYVDASQQASHAAELAAIATGLSSLDVKLMHDGPLPAFAAKLANEPGTNLLQGRFAPRSDWRRALQPWRLAASLLATLIVASLVANGVTYVSLRRQDAALTDAIAAQCIEQLSTDRINQCQSEVQALLQSSGQIDVGGEGFLSTLGTFAEFASATNRFEQMSYRNRVLSAVLQTADVTTLDELEKKIDETGRFDMTIQNTSPREEGGIQARIVVETVTR